MSLPLKVALGGSSLLLLGAVAVLLYTAAELRDFHTDSLKELDEWKYYEKEAWGEMTVIQRERRSPLTGKAFERRFYREQTGDSDSTRFTRMSYGSNQAQCNCGIQPSHCPPGPPGPPGGVGAHGEPGLQGEPGKRGASGVALIATYQQQAPGCIQCEIGPPGLPGVDGFPGEMGPPGQPGEAAYPVAGGLPGMPGPPGDQGRPGDSGMPGGPGIPGQDAVCQIGQPGPVGARGPQGEMGLPGVTPGYVQPGEPGPPGPLGRPGNPGRDGQPGQPGYPGGPGRPGDDAHYCSCPPPTARASEQRAAQPKNTYSRPSNQAALPIPASPREDQAVESLSREEYRKRVVARLLMKRKLMALQARMHA